MSVRWSAEVTYMCMSRNLRDLGLLFVCFTFLLFVCSPAHCTAMLGLLDLQLGEELDEPLEALLVPVDPEEVNLGSGGSGV